MAYIDLKRETIIKRTNKAAEQKGGRALAPQEVADALNRSNIDDPLEICDALVAEGVLFRRTDERFVSRSNYFAGGKVLIKPTEEEREEGILIPGHRFLPLYDPLLHPGLIEIRVQGGKPRRKKIIRNIRELGIYYNIFRNKTFIEIVASETEANARLIGKNENWLESPMNITVFDMERIYRQWDIRPGDYLLAEAEDWHKGRFILSPVSSAERDAEEERREWISALDTGFKILFSEVPWPLPPEEELARAFFRAGPVLIQDPALHIGGYLAESDVVGLVSIDGTRYLWKKGSEIDEQAREWAGRLETRLRGSLFEELLARYEVPVPLPYAEACIRQNREEDRDFSHLIHSVFAGVDLRMLEYKEWDRLARALESYRDNVSSRSNGTVSDKTLRRERTKFIFLYQDIMEWLIKTEEHFGSLEAADLQYLKDLVETAHRSVDILHILNKTTNTIDEESIETLDTQYTLLEGDFRRLTTWMWEQLTEDMFKQRREARLNTAAAEYMVFDITIEDLEPPVYRKIRLPDTMSLGDFHNVLQKSFDWKDYHLHSFFINHTAYTDLETSEQEFLDGPEDQDEEDLFVADIPDLGGELLYVYDYGDDWRHRIRLREVVPASSVPEEERESAVCLDGKGAGPPEDCGGPPGYERLIEAVNTAPAKRDDEQNEVIQWADGRRPNNFQLQELNRTLKKL